jgi:hypothetical protein
MDQKPGAGAAAGNRVVGHRRRNDGIAGAAESFTRACRITLNRPGTRLSDVLTDPAQRVAQGGDLVEPARPLVSSSESLSRSVAVGVCPTEHLTRMNRRASRIVTDRGIRHPGIGRRAQADMLP